MVLRDGALRPEGPAAVSMWLFDDASEPLPGGFEQSELSPKAPAMSLKSFPQDLVFVARSSVLIKGLAARLGVEVVAGVEVGAHGRRGAGFERKSRARACGGAGVCRSSAAAAVGRRLSRVAARVLISAVCCGGGWRRAPDIVLSTRRLPAAHARLLLWKAKLADDRAEPARGWRQAVGQKRPSLSADPALVAERPGDAWSSPDADDRMDLDDGVPAARPALATARARAGRSGDARAPGRSTGLGGRGRLAPAAPGGTASRRSRRRAVGRLQSELTLRTRSRRLMSKPTRKRSTTFEQASTARERRRRRLVGGVCGAGGRRFVHRFCALCTCVDDV